MNIEKSELKNTSYELFIGAISLLSILNLLLIYLVTNSNTEQVLFIINSILSIIFIIDFTLRLLTAKSKSNYFIYQYGWADLLASVPLPQFKILRVFRLFRIYIISRSVGTGKLIKAFFKARGNSALFTILFVALLVFEFGSMSILAIEGANPDSNIKSASDALWWVMTTITTVGYGDKYPITNPGRIVGALVMITGISLFGILSGYLANLFLVKND